jgi:pimeloyl-ACP methyl ester carboxylesterase
MISIRLPQLPLLSTLAALGLAGCSHYSSVSEKRPAYRYQALTPVGAIIAKALELTPVGAIIAKALETPRSKPEAMLGCYLDAAAAAEGRLRANPRDADAQRDYNFAVGRVFEVIRDAKMEPWAKPVAAVGAEGPRQFSLPADRRPERDPARYHILPADRYQFHGTYVAERAVKAGLGAPLVVSSKPEMDFVKVDRFAQGRHVYYGLTALLRFEGRRCHVEFADPLTTETVRLAGHTFPLAADFTASIALALARENPKKLELARLLRPEKYAQTARLARLQPYDPAKIPVICVHGLNDSPATWAPLIQALRADPDIRRRYQVWFYSYPSGYPYPHSAAIMREQLDAIRARYPGHKDVVLIGHSMGGCISRLMITDTGDKLWRELFKTTPAETPLSPETKKLYSDALIFQHRPEVDRVIFIAAPLRGSDLATGWVGRIGSMLVKAPTTLLRAGQDAMKLVTLQGDDLRLKRIPNSVDTLAPNNRFVKLINAIPITPGIPYHVISGDRGKGGNKDKTPPVMSDGIVPYWSSHLDGARSDLVVPSNHSAHQHPQAIEEVRRILKLHAR